MEKNITTQHIVIGFVVLALLIGLGTFIIMSTSTSSVKDVVASASGERKLTDFSDFEEWNERALALAERSTTLVPDIQISLKDPSVVNTVSYEVLWEEVGGIVTAHNPDLTDRFIAIRNIDEINWGPFNHASITDSTVYPATAKLIDTLLTDVRILVMQQKKIYDQPRPYHVVPAFPHVYKVGTPSYPSLRAAEIRVMTDVMQLLDAKNAETYIGGAIRFQLDAYERMGWIVYSDHLGGLELGQQYLDALKQDEEALQLLKAAQAEWST